MKKTILLTAFLLLLLAFAARMTQLIAVEDRLFFGAVIFAITVVLWITEFIPLAITALLVPVLICLFGLDTASGAFAPFGNEILYLFLGTFFIARAMEKHGWDKRMAYFVLAYCPVGNSLVGITFLLAGMSFVLSMWISNTATAAICCALALSIIKSVESELQDEIQSKKATAAMLLLVAYAASIGGIATPMGSPPNLIAIGLLKNRGIEISFLEWVSFALPIAMLMMAGAFSWFWPRLAKIKLSTEAMGGLQQEFRTRLQGLGNVSIAEKQVAAVFVFAVSFWVLPGVLSTLFPEVSLFQMLQARVTMGVVAIAATFLLFFAPVGKTRNLVWEDSRAIDWGTILLFGGGLCLGAMLEKVGLTALIGQALVSFAEGQFLIYLLVVTATAIFATEVTSNTATATIFASILIGALPTNATIAECGVLLAATLGTSFAFMLPVATPPNAIVFGTGRVAMSEMIRAGLLLNLFGILILVFWFGLAAL